MPRERAEKDEEIPKFPGELDLLVGWLEKSTIFHK